MAYKLNKTDGSLLVDLIDGTIDTSSTSLTLVGRNYTGFGEYLNENYIKLLENFSNTNAPSNPITGQLWWDTTQARLKVYEGQTFKAVGGPFVQKTEPNMVAGDLWIDNLNDQIYFYDGEGTPVLAGPLYTKDQGLTGFKVETLRDVQDRTRTVASLYIGNASTGTERVAVISNLEFTPAVGFEIAGITGNIKKGINIVSSDFIYEGTADIAKALLTSSGQRVVADDFLTTSTNSIISGSLTVSNSAGITIGPNANTVISPLGADFVYSNQLLDENVIFRVTSSGSGAGQVDAIYIDAQNQRVGVFKSNPDYTLDVSGDLRITGNLLVEGTQASIDVNNLRIQDKQIELAITDDSTLVTDTAADDAGMVVRVTGNDKKWTWIQATNSWTSNVNANLTSGNTYKIDGNDVLSATALGTGVTSANGLSSIGTLTSLAVDNVSIDGNTITTTGGGLNLTLAGNLDLTNNNKITGLGVPSADTDAASKVYVDEQIAAAAISFSMDATGLNDTQIGLVLEDLVPASSVAANGTIARIHCTSLAGATVSNIDITAVTTKSFIAVDSAGVQNESVLQDVAFGSATGTVSVTITRALKEYVTSSGAWTFSQDLVSSV